MKSLTLPLLITLGFLSQNTQAGILTPNVQPNPVRVGVPIYGGTGCPQGTAAISQSGRSALLNVDSFEAHAPAANGSNFDRKSCSLRLPVQVLRGYQMVIKGIVLKGDYNIPAGGRGAFEQRVSYVGQIRPQITRMNLAGQGTLSLNPSGNPQDWIVTACSTGRDLMLNVDVNLLTTTNPTSQYASASIQGFAFNWELKRCRP